MQKIIIQNHSDADQRLDKFLKKFLPNAPLGAIYKMLRTGKIKVNDKKKEQTYRLAENDEILIFLNDEELEKFQKIYQNKLVIKKGLEFGIQTHTIPQFQKLFDNGN